MKPLRAFCFVLFMGILAPGDVASEPDSGELGQHSESELDDLLGYPRSVLVGCDAQNEFGSYAAAAVQRIKRVGMLNYPTESGHKLQGKVFAQFEIAWTGALGATVIETSSGHEKLDSATVELIRMAAPFLPFPESIRNKADVLVVRCTFNFAGDV